MKVKCVYCREREAVTKDHVPPKFLFPKPRPSNLKRVPSCFECNNAFSEDEEYFKMLVTGLMSHTSEADVLFDGSISRSFDRNEKLEDLFWHSLRVHNDLPYIEIDHNRISRIIRKILAGLLYTSYNNVLDKSTSIHYLIIDTEFLPKNITDFFKNSVFQKEFEPVLRYRFSSRADPIFASYSELVFYNTVHVVCGLK